MRHRRVSRRGERRGHRVTGLDLSQQAVAYVRHRYPGIDVRCATLDSGGLCPESFDVVAGFHVLEHVTDPVGLLCQMTHLVRPGGLVYPRALAILTISSIRQGWPP